jgi:hypothetical protein
MRTVLTTVILMITIGAYTHAEPRDFEIAMEKKADRLLAMVVEGRTVLDIHSRSGIGAADVTRTKPRWPEAVVVRLHLGMLECFAITSGKTRLTTSVASHGGRAKRLHVEQDGIDNEVDKDSPYWTEIKVLGRDGKPTADYPLKDGYFEIALPAALLRDQPKTITLAWIDAYRR